MADINSKYHLDLEQPLAGLRALQKEALEFNQTITASSKTGSDAFKGVATAAEKYNHSLRAGVQAAHQTTQANQGFSTTVKSLTDRIFGYTSAQDKAIAKQKQLDSAIKNTSAGGSKMGGIFNELKGQLTSFFGIGAILEFGKSALTAAADYEQLKVSFTTFLGSAEKADEVLSKLTRFSNETPYEPEQVNQAGKSLLAFGITARELIPTLTKIGDIASGTGKDFNELATIYGKAKIAGTLYAEDINQLVEAGIPIIDQFAKQMGISNDQVKKFASEGKIKFSELETAFTNLSSEGGLFFNLMDKQSETTSGKFSTFLGNVKDVARGFGEFLLPAANEVLDVFGKLAGKLVELGKNDFVRENEAAAAAADELVKSLGSLDKVQTENKMAELTAKNKELKDSLLDINERLVILRQESGVLDKVFGNSEVEKLEAKYKKLGEQFLINEQAIKLLNEGLEATNATSIPKQIGLIEALQAKLKSLKDDQEKAVTVGSVRSIGKQIEATQKELDDLLGKTAKKSADELKKLLEDLDSKAAKARLDTMDKDSREYIEAVFEAGEKEIDALEKQLRERAKLTQEQEDQLSLLREANANQRINQLLELNKKEADASKKSLEENKKASEEFLALEEQIAIERIRNEQRLKGSGSAEVRKAEQFEKDKQIKVFAVQIEFAERRLKLLEGVGGQEAELQKLQLQNMIADLEGEIQKLSKGEKKKFDIFELLGLDLEEDEKQAVIGAFNEIGGAVNELMNTQIAASQAVIDQKSKEIDHHKAELDRQIELNKQGYASDIQGERDRIKTLEKERQQALNRQKAAQRAQLLLDSAAQISSLITASANIFKVTSPILPPLGQILAVTAIAAMFGSFIAGKAKAFQAANAASVPSFRKGGSLLLDGPSHEQGGVDVVNTRTGKRIANLEGDEHLFVVNKGATRKHKAFVEAINDDDFSGIGFNDFSFQKMLSDMNISPAKELPKQAIRLQSKSYQAEKHGQFEALALELREVKDKLSQIEENTANIPAVQRAFDPDGNLHEYGPNFHRKIRKAN